MSTITTHITLLDDVTTDTTGEWYGVLGESYGVSAAISGSANVELQVSHDKSAVHTVLGVVSTVAATAIDSSTTTIVASDASRYSANDIVKIDDEYMKITGLTNNTMSVGRGYSASEITSHSNGSTIIVNDWMSFNNEDRWKFIRASSNSQGAGSIVSIKIPILRDRNE